MCCMQSRCARLPRAHAQSISPRSRSFAGYFQSEEGRFSCIYCDSLGDYYQELPAQSGCRVCPQHTQRFVGALDASNRSSCQCKEGAVCCSSTLSNDVAAVLTSDRLHLNLQATSTRSERPGRSESVFSIRRLHLCCGAELMVAAGVRKM